MAAPPLASLQRSPHQPLILPPTPTSSSSFQLSAAHFNRRAVLTSSAALLAAWLLDLKTPSPAIASQELDQEDEDRLVRVFQETSPCVVFIKDLKVVDDSRNLKDVSLDEEEGDVRVEGTGSGFIWDKFGHIVTNYHVVAKLATDTSGRRRCKVILVDANGNRVSKEGTIVGCDPAYDLAILKVDAEGSPIKPVALGTSGTLRVGQSCFAIGNPYGFENTLTTGSTTIHHEEHSKFVNQPSTPSTPPPPKTPPDVAHRSSAIAPRLELLDVIAVKVATLESNSKDNRVKALYRGGNINGFQHEKRRRQNNTFTTLMLRRT